MYTNFAHTQPQMQQNSSKKTELSSPFSFSQSSLQDYVDCARRFQLLYIEQLKWPAVETMPVLENERRQLEGQQFHRMVQQHLVGLPANKLERMANTETLARWWQHFLDFRNQEDFGIIHPELTISAPVGKHRLMAKYDLISVKDNHTIIYDWKTYQKRPENTDMDRRLQTRVYPALLVLAGSHINNGNGFTADQVEMQYWYAEFPNEPYQLSYSGTIHKHDLLYINSLIDEISAKQSYPPTDNEKKCAFCVYRSFCERGVFAGEAESMEIEGKQIGVDLEQIQEIEF